MALSGSGFTVSPTSLAFGSHLVNTTTADQLVTVTNPSTTDSMSFSGFGVTSNQFAVGTTWYLHYVIGATGELHRRGAFQSNVNGVEERILNDYAVESRWFERGKHCKPERNSRCGVVLGSEPGNDDLSREHRALRTPASR